MLQTCFSCAPRERPSWKTAGSSLENRHPGSDQAGKLLVLPGKTGTQGVALRPPCFFAVRCFGQKVWRTRGLPTYGVCGLRSCGLRAAEARSADARAADALAADAGAADAPDAVLCKCVINYLGRHIRGGLRISVLFASLFSSQLCSLRISALFASLFSSHLCSLRISEERASLRSAHL